MTCNVIYVYVFSSCRIIKIMNTELDELIIALEEGGKSEGRGIRVSSYTSAFTAKNARLRIIEKLKELRRNSKFDYYPTA